MEILLAAYGDAVKLITDTYDMFSHLKQPPRLFFPVYPALFFCG
jgi:hypothetical protein